MSHDRDALQALFDELVSLAAYEWARTEGLDLSSREDTAKIITHAARWRERFETLTCPNHHHAMTTGTAGQSSHHHYPTTGSTCTHAGHDNAYAW